MIKKNNFWHLIWVIGVYAILILLLILIVEYKVNWENKDLNTYLYFYKCSGNLCTTNEKIDNYYSKIKCDNKTCPYIKEKYNSLVVLADNEKEYIFDYTTDHIINNSYQRYNFVNDYLIVKNNENKYGVISIDGNVLVEPKYNKIIDYKNGYLAYSENAKIGIVNEETNINIKPAYESIVLIDDSIYAYLEDNKYYIASYDTELPINNTTYDYVYSTNNVILTIKDKKIDILDSSLTSNLLLKIDTSYSYTEEKERESLNLHKEGNLLHFDVYGVESTTAYIYDLKNNKLFN